MASSPASSSPASSCYTAVPRQVARASAPLHKCSRRLAAVVIRPSSPASIPLLGPPLFLTGTSVGHFRPCKWSSGLSLGLRPVPLPFLLHIYLFVDVASRRDTFCMPHRPPLSLTWDLGCRISPAQEQFGLGFGLQLVHLPFPLHFSVV
jgi:hypothetical protein